MFPKQLFIDGFLKTGWKGVNQEQNIPICLYLLIKAEDIDTIKKM